MLIQAAGACARAATTILVFTVGLALTGCDLSHNDLKDAPASAGNRAPVISGKPLTSVRVGETYVFAPTARDPDGDALSFTVAGKPSWASFDSSTGRLSGSPPASASGTTSDVTITVTDGTTTATLPSFGITVEGTSTGSATVTLTWAAPTRNEDGSALTDLAGYRILYGNAPGSWTASRDVPSATATSFTVDFLPAGTWYFAIQSYNLSKVTSSQSGVVSAVIG